MKKYNFTPITLVCTFLIILCLFAVTNTAFGLSLMGPPRSLLHEGESAFALELGYSEMDLQTFGDVSEALGISYTEYKIENLKSIMPSVRLDTNIFENWDVFVRLGAADASGDITEEQADGTTGQQYKDFDGSFGYTLGIGTRTTFYKEKEGNTSWGGVFQVNWANPGDSDITNDSDSSFTGKAEISYWEVQMAIGPTVEYENVRIYGGPFLHFVNGELDLSGNATYNFPPPLPVTIESSHEIREESQLGGFLGAQFNLGNNNTLVTEAQFTGDAWGIGICTAWKF